ncbi:MAG TPA: hypothetical protein VNJ09_09445 [Chthonomonadales bacterium]|nr:hypothetical protein [Chthonomonadales bacterium]
MKRSWVVLAVIVTVVASVVVANAQGGPRGRRGGMFGFGPMMGGGSLFMLRIPEVQQELKMTPPQIEKLDAKQQEVMEAMRSTMEGAGGPQGLQGMSPEERSKLMQKIQSIQQKAISDILDAQQQKRFHQIELQAQGGMALMRPDVAAELKLSSDQQTKMRQIVQAGFEEQRKLAQGLDFRNMSDEERQKLFSKRQEIQKSTNEKLLAVLTDAQRKQWVAMTGPPFKFPEMGFGFGPGRGPGFGPPGSRPQRGGAPRT